MAELSVEELARWRADGREFVLLDVREAREIAAVSLPGSVHMPMREVPLRCEELDTDAEIAVLCHYGARSGQVAQYLSARGFTRVHNVDGGIDEYALRVDPSLPRY